MEVVFQPQSFIKLKGDSKMKCKDCEQDKNIWTDLFAIRVGGHKDDPRNIYVCKKCYQKRVMTGGKI